VQSWINQTGALVHASYPGQNGGQALAEILFGTVNPSGKLPFTWEKRIEDNPAFATFPWPLNQKPPNPTTIQYSEGIFVGYRGYEKNGVTPQFPFGFGLSYTSFAYSDLDIEPAEKDDDGEGRGEGEKRGDGEAKVALCVITAAINPTLCGLLFYRGMARFIANDETKRFGSTGFEALRELATGSLGPVPMPFVLLILIGIIAYIPAAPFGVRPLPVWGGPQRGRGALFGDQQPDDHSGHLRGGDAPGRHWRHPGRLLYQLDLAG
jgi:hypothetical protein